ITNHQSRFSGCQLPTANCQLKLESRFANHPRKGIRMRQIILDTETTGLEPELGHRIIEIAGVELVNRQFTGNDFHRYLNPERDIDVGALEVHGITTEFLADKPRFRDIAAELLDYLRGAELVIHNSAFDIAFINHELSLCGLAPVTECCA